MAEEEGSKYAAEYEGNTIQTLAAAMVETAAEIARLGALKTELQKRYDFLRQIKVPEVMDEQGIRTVTLDGLLNGGPGRVTIQGGVWARIRPDAKPGAYEWLDKHGHGELIVGTVNAGSLRALVKDLMQKGIEIPEDLFVITPYSQASITKV